MEVVYDFILEVLHWFQDSFLLTSQRWTHVWANNRILTEWLKIVLHQLQFWNYEQQPNLISTCGLMLPTWKWSIFNHSLTENVLTNRFSLSCDKTRKQSVQLTADQTITEIVHILLLYWECVSSHGSDSQGAFNLFQTEPSFIHTTVAVSCRCSHSGDRTANLWFNEQWAALRR